MRRPDWRPRRGDRESFKTLHAAWRERVLQRVAERAAVVESERQTLAQTRDAILAEQFDAPPIEVPEIRTPEPAPILDTTKVAVRRTVATAHGSRTEYTIENTGGDSAGVLPG